MSKKNLKIIERLFVITMVIIISSFTVRAIDKKVKSGSNSSRYDACEDGMVFVSSATGGFCIDIYEASTGDDCPYKNPGKQSETRVNLDYEDCTPIVKKDAIPWRNISQNQAAQACAKAGKRLASNKEWQQAVLGTLDKASAWTENDCQVASNWQRQPGKCGSGLKCVSSVGAFDMIGNVWEWVDGTLDNGFFEDRELPEQGFIVGVDENGIPYETKNEVSDENYYEDYLWIKKSGIRGIARGGYWGNESGAGQYASYMVAKPSFAGVGVGFRCVK